MNWVLLLILSTAIKFAGYVTIYPSFRMLTTLPHFYTPLNSIRELNEMFYMYRTTGDFYMHTNQIGQSELLLKALYYSQQYVNLKLILALGDISQILMRLLILRQTNVKYKYYISIFICFNPLNVFG